MPRRLDLQTAAWWGALLAAAAGITAIAAGGPATGWLSDLAGIAVGTLTAVGCAAAAARLSGAARRAWALMASAAAAYAGGDAVWVLTPGWPADALYLAWYPLFLAGVLSLPSAPWTPREAVRTALDLAVALLGSGMVVWQEVMQPLARKAAGDTTVVAAVAYPVGDLVLLLALGLLLLRHPTRGTRASLHWLVASVGLQVVGDLAYAMLTLDDRYASGHPIDVAWYLGLLSLGGAARAQRPTAPGDDERGAPLPAGSALPYIGFVLGFVLVAQLAWEGHPGTGRDLLIVLGGATLLCALVILRQVLAQRELDDLSRALQARNLALQEEQARSEALLLNVLPAPVAARLKDRPTEVLADPYDEATVVFADLVGFTALGAARAPEELVTLLNDVFSRFDQLATAHGVEKIKTIGDAYMAVCGVPTRRADHAAPAARFALGMLDAVAEVNRTRGLNLAVRVGLHSGPLVAGVIGEHRFIFDLWGDTVNVASRMESHGEPGRVHASDATRRRLGDAFACEARGTIELRGRGPMPTWFVDSTRG